VSPAGLAIAAAAAAVGSALNSAAGGGSFVTFPALVFLGMPPVPANATNSAGMWIGNAGSIGGYREDLAHPTRRLAYSLATCLAGGALGGWLLLHVPAAAFSAAVPWLLLASTLAFVFAPWIRGLAARGGRDERDIPPGWLPLLFPVSVYGGFFGGGQGILVLSVLSLAGLRDPNRMNALKMMLVFVNNGTPLVPFILSGILSWDVVIAMGIGGSLGGYVGARVARRIPGPVMRWFIIGTGALMTVVFFLKK
jgi:hypothetical protein